MLTTSLDHEFPTSHVSGASRSIPRFLILWAAASAAGKCPTMAQAGSPARTARANTSEAERFRARGSAQHSRPR